MIEYIAIDVDSSLLPKWRRDWIKTRRAIAEALGYRVKRVIIRPSGEPWPPSKPRQKPKHYHAWIWIETPKPLTDLEKLKLQWLLGDDYGRCWINYLRITRRKTPLWNKIFSHILWRRPLPEQCRRCSLRVNLERLAEGGKHVPDEGQP